MRKRIFSLAALTFIATAAYGSVTPIDSTNTAFLDSTTGLIWTNGNAFDPLGMTFANAVNAVAALVTAGYEDWRLPTASEFNSLYAAQGTTGTAMMRDPLSLNANFYWTSSIYLATTPIQYFAFNPNTTFGNQNSTFFASTRVGVWAVSAVPELSSVVLFAVGGTAVVALLQRRRRVPGAAA